MTNAPTGTRTLTPTNCLQKAADIAAQVDAMMDTDSGMDVEVVTALASVGTMWVGIATALSVLDTDSGTAITYPWPITPTLTFTYEDGW